MNHQPLQTGCRGWNCTSIRAFKGRCPTIRRPGNKWWPARVTRPVLRIKSPLHHFNACRPKIGARGRIRTCTGDALDVVPLLVGLHERIRSADILILVCGFMELSSSVFGAGDWKVARTRRLESLRYKRNTSGRSLSPTHVLHADRLSFFALGGVKMACRP